MDDHEELYEEAEKLRDWATTRSEDLRSLISDQQFLSNSKGNKILFAVDVFDVIKLAFPFADIGHKPKAEFGRLEQDDLLSGQLGRSCLFLNLPNRDDRLYNPLLLPGPYMNEFYSTLNSPNIVTPRSESFASRFAQLQKELKEILGDSDIEVLLEARNPVGLDAIVRLCPELLFALTGHIEQGFVILRNLFQNNKLTLNLAEWTPLEQRHRDRLLKGNSFDGFNLSDRKEDAKWQSIMENALRTTNQVFRPTYITDLRAIRFVDYLNRELNHSNILVLYVSGANTMETLFQYDDARKKAVARWCDQKGQSHEVCFFRNMDVFRFYLRHTEFDLQNPSFERVIISAQEDLKKLEAFTGPNVGKTINDVRSFREEFRQRWFSSDIDTLKAELASVQSLKRTLQSLHLSASCRQFMSTYELGNIHLLDRTTYTGKSAVAKGNLSRYAELITSILKAATYERHKELLEHIVRYKVLLISEFLHWRNVADIYSLQRRLKKGSSPIADPIRRQFRKYFRDFVLFPFRVKFQTQSLVDELQELSRRIEDIQYGARYEVDSAAEFYESLMNIARKCAIIEGGPENYWGSDLDVGEISENGVERRLVILVLLLALGNADDVIADTERLLDVRNIPLVSELRILNIQARIRNVLRQSDTAPQEDIKEVVGKIVDLALRASQDVERESGRSDARFQYLAAFASGCQAGHWHPKYNRQWTIDTCFKALAISGREDVGQESLDWFLENKRDDDLHLVQSIIASLAYYLAVNGTKDEVEEALRIHNHPLLMSARFTGLCLYDKAAIYVKMMEFHDSPSQLNTSYDSAISYYTKAQHRLFSEDKIQVAIGRASHIREERLSKLNVDLSDKSKSTDDHT